MKSFFRCVLWFLGVVVLLLLCACGFLFGFQHALPNWVLQRFSDALSTDAYYVACDAIVVDFPRNWSVRGLRVLNRNKKDTKPFLSASRADVQLTFSRLPWSLRNVIKEVTIWDLVFPRLPEGYYIPDSIEFPGQPDFRECNKPVEGTLPEIKPFRLRLIRPNVLAVTPTEVLVANVRSSERLFKMENITLEWPDTDYTMSLDGKVVLDLEHQCVVGGVHGQARQANIRPMLQALEITNSYSFIDAFTGVTTPVDATCKFDVNLCNDDLHIFLDLHPTGGAYRGVPLQNVHGTVDIRVFVRDTFQNAVITVGPIMAHLGDGNRLSGSVVYENTNDVGYVNFDCKTTTSLSNALAIANVLNDGTLDCLKTFKPGEITLSGVLAVDPTYAATNNLEGTFTSGECSLFSVQMLDVFTRYALKGTDALFTEAHATTRHGGGVMGDAVIHMPGFREQDANFNVNISAVSVPLVDLADVFHFDLGDRTGRVSGDLQLAGPLGTNIVPRLKGKGTFVCENGHLAKFNFFSGFFSLLSSVPGLQRIMQITSDTASVSMSRASAKYEIARGILTFQDFRVEGSTFFIDGEGHYDMVTDCLDFDLRLRLKKDTILGTITRTFSWTLPNFFQFKVFGSLDRPNWRPASPDWKKVISNPLE